MTSAKKEAVKAGIMIASFLAGLGFLAAWRAYVIPSLSAAFLVDGSSASQIHLLLLIIGVIILTVLVLLIWVTVLMLRVKKLSDAVLCLTSRTP